MLYREEQFGPIVPVMPFEDLETALEYVITSEHGQQVSIFSEDPEGSGTADPLVNQVCRVNINCQCQRGPDVFPFTGRKDRPGHSVGHGCAALVFDRSTIAAKQTEDSKRLLDAIVNEHKSNFIRRGLPFDRRVSEIRERPAGLGCRCAVTVTPRSSPPGGRASSSPNMIRALFETGADVFRFNFSHGSHQEHQQRYHIVRAIEQETVARSPCSPIFRDRS